MRDMRDIYLLIVNDITHTVADNKKKKKKDPLFLVYQNRCILQSRTNKVNKSDILASNQYLGNLIPDSYSAQWNTSKNTYPKSFPRAVQIGHFFDRNQWHFKYLVWVDDGIQVHHGTSGNCAMALLLAHCPRCGFARQWNPVSVHKSPGTIDELPDDINRAWVKCGNCCLLRIFKCLFLNLAVSVLDPTPVLEIKILV
jgi:hypothetical protein